MMSDGSLSPFPLRGEEHGREKVAPVRDLKPSPAIERKELRDGMCEMADPGPGQARPEEASQGTRHRTSYGNIPKFTSQHLQLPARNDQQRRWPAVHSHCALDLARRGGHAGGPPGLLY
ncbi:hypothetical protein CKAH01_01866 [Colletotrichum kahawae]|uniref:Uncharacterized protein n=1 Tax=Colletotrichum kahawae TaxID=34407 RepID=A0AAD9Y584_COLKA|nr:hypothetical protein CKAH01_01866 [Colletotrichum kahawae]